MDTTKTTRTRRIAAFLLVIVATLALAADRPTPQPPLTVVGATADEEQVVDWALHRFRAAGLEQMPDLDVHLHASREDCRGALGRYKMGRVDLCTKDSSEKYAKKFALHEMAHAWVEANVDAETLERFMDIRSLSVWNDARHPWKERGSEQAAEIITWGLGEGDVIPLLPEVTDPAVLTDLFEMLTGRPPITPQAI